MKSLFLKTGPGLSFTGKEKMMYVLTALFFITLYLPGMPVINNIFIALIFGYSFFYNSIDDKLKLLKQRKAVACMLLFYALHLVSAFFSVNKEEAARLLGLRIPLLMFPIAIGLIYIRQELKERILLLYSFITTVAACVCFAAAFVKYRVSHDMQFLYNDNFSMAIEKQSIYFALMVNLAIFSYIYLLTRNSRAARYRGLVYLAIFSLLIVNFMLASRVSIIVLYLALLTFTVFHIIKKRRFLEGATIIMGLLIGGFLMAKFFPKTLNRFKELSYTDYQYNNQGPESHFNMKLTADQWNGANIRLAVWSCGWELARRNLVLGARLGDKKDKMMEIYKARQFDFALKTERNMHNNYLDVLCTFGIVGLAVFLLGYFIFPLVSCYHAKDALGIFITSAFAFVLVSETYLDRSLGCVLVGYFASFIASYKRELKQDQ